MACQCQCIHPAGTVLSVHPTNTCLWLSANGRDSWPAGTTPDPTLGQGGGAIYAASFNVLNITSSTFSQNTASRVNITDFKQGRGAGGAISVNSDTLITSSCSAGIVSITGARVPELV